MIELPLLFAAGAVGSAHCVGMCGGFVLSLSAGTTAPRVVLLRQALYATGRIATYAFLGAIAALAAGRLDAALPAVTRLPSLMALLAGGVLLHQGLRAVGVLPPRRIVPSGAKCLASTFFGAFLRTPQSTGPLLAGIMTGFLPCGLLYGMLVLAAGAGTPGRGAAAMIAFGAGTVPALALVGCIGALASLGLRRRLHGAAAWCLVATGVLSLARGAWFLVTPWTAEAGCPFCS
jgi:sulfite exporter TauE/SafE